MSIPMALVVNEKCLNSFTMAFSRPTYTRVPLLLSLDGGWLSANSFQAFVEYFVLGLGELQTAVELGINAVELLQTEECKFALYKQTKLLARRNWPSFDANFNEQTPAVALCLPIIIEPLENNLCNIFPTIKANKQCH